MKQNILIIPAIIIAISVHYSVQAAEWDDFGNIDRMWDGQESITNKEFEEVMDALQSNQKKKETKQRKKLIKKISGGGTSLHGGLEPDSDIEEVSELKAETEGQLLNIPVNLLIDGVPIEKGYYNVIGKKDENGKIYLYFYQSEFLKGKVLAFETTDDFNQETLDFVKLIPQPDSKVKIIFGSLGFNAYAFLPYKPE